MPRQSRLDGLGALHHIIGGRIERGKIFPADYGRQDFLNRVAELCKEGDLVVYA